MTTQSPERHALCLRKDNHTSPLSLLSKVKALSVKLPQFHECCLRVFFFVKIRPRFKGHKEERDSRPIAADFQILDMYFLSVSCGRLCVSRVCGTAADVCQLAPPRGESREEALGLLLVGTESQIVLR